MTTAHAEQAFQRPVDEVAAALLSLTEDQWFERKSARALAKDLADSLIGFGNAEGGTVVLGLWNGMIEGTDRDARRRNDQMQAAIDFTVPPVRARCRLVPCLRDDGATDHLLVIDVEPGEGVVHANRKDVVFLRVGDENRRLSFHQRQELTYDKGQGSYETRYAGYIATIELDHDLLDQYAESVGTKDAMHLLEARGLLRDGQVTVAGTLLFAKAPEGAFPEAHVRVIRYRGSERGTGSRQQLLADVRIEGPLPRQILDARDLVRELQPTRRALSNEGLFANMPLVPEDAWLEALVNAVVHRSYSLAGDHIRVEIFEDRIEVTSPGRFPGLVAISDPQHATRYARNPRIARVCADLNFGQELGEGIKRIYEEMRLAGLGDPLYRQSSGAVHLELSGVPADRKLDALLPFDTREVVATLREAKRLSTMEIAERIGLSRPATLKRLNAMRRAGLVEWIGNSPKDPRAYWRLPSR
jgi:ATP-dependent DNA helicase RecG